LIDYAHNDVFNLSVFFDNKISGSLLVDIDALSLPFFHELTNVFIVIYFDGQKVS